MASPTYEQVMQALQAADAAGNVEDAKQLAQMAASMVPKEAPAAKATTPQAAKESDTSYGSFGRRLASLADTTVGGVLPAVAQTVAYPLARLVQTPEGAKATTENVVSAIDKPFGKMAGVTDTPEYQNEASRKLMEFIGSNVEKGAKWIAEKTGIPQADVESYVNSLAIAAPAVAKPIAKKAAPIIQDVAEKAKTEVMLPFENQIRERNQRLSSEDYARGPQIDAAKEAQRLGILLKPTDIQSTPGTKLTTSLAGQEGLDKIASANKNNVRKIVLNDLDLPPDTQLDGTSAFSSARLKVAQPYSDIRKLPKMVADENTLNALNELRPEASLIGSDKYAVATNKIIDDAVKKVSEGLTGEQMLNNVQVLRKRAQTTYRNKNATLEALDAADTNLALANTLEKMIESNVFDPRLVSRFREARQQMAKTYAYEGATDFNTGLVDVNRLAKITAKDNALTGDIASLGKIAGNFPDAFSTLATDRVIPPHLKRSGVSGALGTAAAYALGGGVEGSIIGGLFGAGLGELSNTIAARKMANPEYQAGLSIRDMRLPVQSVAAPMAPPIPQSQAVVPYQAPVEVLGPGEGPYRPNFTMQPNTYGPRVTPTMPPSQGLLSAPSAEGTLNALRAEDARRASVSRAVGQQQEAAQAQAEAASRKPTSGGLVLDIDPITGKIREASQGIKGATPETFSNFGSSLETAANKVSLGRSFDMTAAEKVAWEKTKVDLAEVAPGFKSLTDKAIAEKMMDREWVAKTAQKAREKADAFAVIERQAANARAMSEAKAQREKMLDLAEQMENSLRMPRPDTSRKQQGPKTRAAFRENLVSFEELMKR